VLSTASRNLGDAIHDRVMGRVALVLGVLSLGSVLGAVIQPGDASDLGSWLFVGGSFLVGWTIWVLIIWHFMKVVRAGGSRS
jgi:hypothetical protein